ncbi:acyltransferase [Alcanivorax sp. HI0083]|uniref:acyltransferase n=1 Tax=unclassified Alcanivorax TaxID=2638842 RepID=UPI0007B90E48|nr:MULTISPECIES: acyltransferase [unclassified Alcanivorax]KZY36818.1 acyltransferase [Alcanivorax sp. HI0044]KZZ25529.1 acyltransferase [Alcanivorax sp. HI0083]PHR67124.1 MAG: acyltransferase [Alcanivorax sp.]
MTIWHKIRATLALTGMLINTLLLCLPLYAFALLRLVLRFEKAQVILSRILVVIAETWIGNNNAIIALASQIKWRISGMDTLSKDQWYLVTCNHQSWADILVLQRISNRRIPFLKFFLKQELIKVPLLGLAWWALDFPFMKRYSKAELEKTPSLKGKDLETTRKACEKFAYFPTSVMNFFEGTRFDAQKHAKQGSPYRHLLKPKAGGAAFTLNAMSGHLRNLLDVTIIYPPGTPRSLMAFLGGAMGEVEVVVQQRVIPAWASEGNYEDDAEFRARFQQWIGELWADKDALLDKKNATRNAQHATR